MITKTDDNTYYNHLDLKQNIAIPSLAHSYSLAIEYMKYWFLKEFDKDFFKSVYIDGKNIFDDFREFNKIPVTKEKPMLAIVPSVNSEYDREKVDLYEGGRQILTRRSKMFNTGFLQDYEHNQFLGIKMRQIEMNFIFKVRVGTRLSQLDLLEYMKLAFRSGSTQSHYMNMDIHVPYEIMLNIAQGLGYQIVNDEKSRPRIVDISSFMRYLNSHSHIPFLYKFRAANGNSEFFIRMKDMFVRIFNLDNIDKDDGEYVGMDSDNFHLEMNVTVYFPAPSFYYYYTNKTLELEYKEKNALARLYTFDVLNIDPPNVDENGWRQYLTTEYIFDEDSNMKEIEFGELLENKNLMTIMKSNIDRGISPSSFMNVKVYNAHKECFIKIDWEKYKIVMVSPIITNQVVITIYVDLEYINNQALQLDIDSRIKE